MKLMKAIAKSFKIMSSGVQDSSLYINVKKSSFIKPVWL